MGEDKRAGRVGRVLAGRYEIVSKLGQGGFSTVWLAADRKLEGKLWAVKEFRETASDQSGNVFRQSLVAEAELMKRLDHPSIVRLVDIVDTGETVFVVMDFVEGRTLSRVLKDAGGPLPQDDVIAWGLQLCDALDYLHAQDPPIVFRDMKPGNVMLREDGSVKLIDFGIAREYKEGRSRDTRVIATEGYAAPEQLDPDVQTDPRADIYSLGVTLYHLVTGHDPTKPPFEIKPIREWDPSLYEGLEAVIARATQPDPDRRYQTVRDMRDDLAHHERLTDAYRSELRRRVRRFRLLVAGSAATLALGIGLLLGGNSLRGSTYEALMREASSAEAVATSQDALERAIAVRPGSIEAWDALVDSYKADLVLTPAESERWSELWTAHAGSIESSPEYARLCYDVGILYLCYYDYGDTGMADATRTTGAAAVENARKAAPWFERARAAAEANEDAAAALGAGQSDSLGVLSVVTRFSADVGRAAAEGREREVYGELWESLCSSLDIVEASDAEPMVRLRLYQIVFETIRSPRYLQGLRRAGVSQDEALATLERIESSTKALEEAARENEQALLPVFEEIVGGMSDAVRNVDATYGNAVAQGEPQEGGA